MLRYAGCAAILLLGIPVCQGAPVPGKDIFWYQPEEPDQGDKDAAAEGTAAAFTGNVELGFVMTRGNSDTETLQTKVAMVHDGEHWRQKLKLEAVRVQDAGTTTTDRYQFNGQSDRKMSSGAYLFAAVAHEVDKFSGFDFQSSLFAGYGRDFVKTEKWEFGAEVGPGYRYSEPVSGDPEQEALLHLAGRGKYQFNEHVAIDASVAHDRGKKQVISLANVSLVSRLNARLAMNINWGFKHNDSPPAGVKKVDVLTSVTVSYSF
jgi:putative salt-induced outer membrane protein